MSSNTTEGIVRDLQAGKRILITATKRGAARDLFLKVIGELPVVLDVKRLSVSGGNERITLHNGGEMLVATPEGARGLTVDAVVALDYGNIPLDKLEGILPALIANDGELIRA